MHNSLCLPRRRDLCLLAPLQRSGRCHGFLGGFCCSHRISHWAAGPKCEPVQRLNTCTPVYLSSSLILVHPRRIPEATAKECEGVACPRTARPLFVMRELKHHVPYHAALANLSPIQRPNRGPHCLYRNVEKRLSCAPSDGHHKRTLGTIVGTMCCYMTNKGKGCQKTSGLAWMCHLCVPSVPASLWPLRLTPRSNVQECYNSMLDFAHPPIPNLFNPKVPEFQSIISLKGSLK